MKKRLLMQLLVLVCAIGAYASNVGDYIYSPTAKFKITGENLVTNGAFDVGDGTTGGLRRNNKPVSVVLSMR